MLSTAEVADWLQVPISTLYAWNYRGVGPRSHKVGRHRRYRRADVERWLNTQADSDDKRR